MYDMYKIYPSLGASPFTREEGSGTLHITDLFFTPRQYRGATIECDIVILAHCDVT